MSNPSWPNPDPRSELLELELKSGSSKSALGPELLRCGGNSSEIIPKCFKIGFKFMVGDPTSCQYSSSPGS